MELEKIFEIIKPQLPSCKVLMHFTSEILTAREILVDGFRYDEYYQNSTTELSSNYIDLVYKFNLYKAYGDFLIIMCIPASYFKKLSEIDPNSKHDILFNLGLCDYLPASDLKYRLRSKYVYGFIDLKKKEFHMNGFFIEG